MLSGHESPAARALRGEIAERLRGGEAALAIEGDLVARYGASIVAIPRDRDPRGGLSISLAVLLGATALTLIALGIRWVRRSNAIERRTEPTAEPADAAALDARIEQEIRRLEG